MQFEQLTVQYVDNSNKFRSLVDYLKEDLNLNMLPYAGKENCSPVFIFKTNVGRLETSGITDIPTGYGETDILLIMATRESGTHYGCKKFTPKWKEKERTGAIFLCYFTKGGKLVLADCHGNQKNYSAMKDICEEYRKQEKHTVQSPREQLQIKDTKENDFLRRIHTLEKELKQKEEELQEERMQHETTKQQLNARHQLAIHLQEEFEEKLRHNRELSDQLLLLKEQLEKERTEHNKTKQLLETGHRMDEGYKSSGLQQTTEKPYLSGGAKQAAKGGDVKKPGVKRKSEEVSKYSEPQPTTEQFGLSSGVTQTTKEDVKKQGAKKKQVAQTTRTPLSAAKGSKEERERTRITEFEERQRRQRMQIDVKIHNTVSRKYNRNEPYTTTASQDRPAYGKSPPKWI